MQSESNRIDPVRRRTVADGPEERVRQAFLRYLIEGRAIPRGLISVETGVSGSGDRAHGMKRTDIVVYDRDGRPWMIIECKAPEVQLSQKVWNQAAGYNRQLDARYLLITNGRTHLCADLGDPDPAFIDSFPDYPEPKDE